MRTRKVLIILATILFFGSTSIAYCATYYIDYTVGLDANNGTAKETPWKRHPYMQGWTGSYNHSAFGITMEWIRPGIQVHLGVVLFLRVGALTVLLVLSLYG